MSNIPHRSYAVTFRPRTGVTDEQVSTMTKWIRRKCEYYYVITEKTDHERHIHAGLFLKTSSTISNLSLTLLRLFKGLDIEEKAILRKGVKTMYNIDFINNYMDKDDDTVVIAKNLPESQTLESYFSEVPSPKKRGPSVADPYYANLEKLWLEHKRPIEETNPVNIRNFLMDMMNNERKLRVISDNRKIFQISVSLSRYINKETSFFPNPEPFHQDV